MRGCRRVIWPGSWPDRLPRRTHGTWSGTLGTLRVSTRLGTGLCPLPLRRRCAPSSVPVLVVVALVLGVPVLVVQVVDVIAVLHCLVAATFSVYMISMLVRAVLF